MNNGYQPLNTNNPPKVPPAVPPRRDRAQYQTITNITNGLATVKRNSLGRGEGQAMLEEVFRASTLSRQGRIPFRREASVPRTSAANWSDSLPRKDLFSSQTNSLPRRDKAGLGRPEPARQPPQPQKKSQQPGQPQQGESSGAEERVNSLRESLLAGETIRCSYSLSIAQSNFYLNLN